MKIQWSAIKSIDAYARAEDHLTQQTVSGALVSVVGITLMSILLANEFNAFLTPYRSYEMAVDVTRGEKLEIHLNMTFPRLPCQVFSLDALDMSGKHEVDLDTNMYKTRLYSDGSVMLGSSEKHVKTEHAHDHDEEKKKPEGSEGAEQDSGEDLTNKGRRLSQFSGNAMNVQLANMFGQRLFIDQEHVNRLKAAVAAEEGCRVHGFLEVERVAGNFHVSVHGQSFHVLEHVFPDPRKLNVSHEIHKLSFGPDYPGKENPLDGTVRILEEKETGGTFKYFLKVVPTSYLSKKGDELHTHQLSVTEYFMPPKGLRDTGMPAVYFLYDLSPITVNIAEKSNSVTHFLTRVCAVVGGVFAVTGMLDRWVHRAITLVYGKL
ncbi:hypothetical protein CYMTET_37876 [Cymbomonas tetramitiformis]|uniref:Endoplasmic reticulum-Golgi intermediate compartment protein 3 n=1 Tax=Cymbomonas tetramitiformis TaxID=36881 RepID=A0AAE0F5S8_9CHLO|nr:hypothetical protein CYMTET_37876 [Cymbomonas tetramitiformis]|eukprot:gene23550-28517_t